MAVIKVYVEIQTHVSNLADKAYEWNSKNFKPER